MKVLVINQFADNKGDRAVLAVILDQLAAAGGVDSVTVATSRTGAWSAEDFKHCNLTVSLVPWGWPRPAGNTLMRRLQYRVMRQIAYPLARTTLAAPRALALDKAILGSLCNRSFLNAVRDADLIISTGGHHFTNWFSREGVSPLFFDLALAEIFGRRVVLWSQTIGALAFADPENQQFVNLLMCKADGIYVRDDGSLAELEQAGVDAAKVHKTHETVFGAETGAWSPPAEREPVVGISIYTGSQRTVAAINAYVAALSGLVNHICGKGYRVRFFPMQLKGQKGDDRDMIGQIVELSESDGQIEVLEEDIPAALHL
ncbi:polysaccharide pyruvyl transferase family protein, partial [bacterium]|nr:polysaccharide pyruvyl transferase family protein [bacterium]